MQIMALNGPVNPSMDNSGSQSMSVRRADQSSTDDEFIPSNANPRGQTQQRKHNHSELASDLSQRYVFAVKDMTSEQKANQPDCQVRYVLITIAYF